MPRAAKLTTAPIAIYALAMSVRLTPEEVRRHVADAREEAEEIDEELAV
jgi:hypothetical protein